MHRIKVEIKFLGIYKQNLTPCLLNLLLTALILIIFSRSFNSTEIWSPFCPGAPTGVLSITLPVASAKSPSVKIVNDLTRSFGR